MDKTKILIVGGGLHSRWLATLLEQHQTIYEIERVSLDDLVRGQNMHQLVLDDLLIADEATRNFDFSKIEQRVLASIPNSRYWETRTGADHTSRKREPKGPRGRWGKPK